MRPNSLPRFVVVLGGAFLISAPVAFSQEGSPNVLFENEKISVIEGFAEGSFTIIDKVNPLSQSALSPGDPPELSMNLDLDRSVRLTTSPDGKRVIMTLFLSVKKGEATVYIDLNTDGQWDARKGLLMGNEAFIDGEWEKVDRIENLKGNDPKMILNDQRFIFSGKWIRDPSQ